MSMRRSLRFVRPPRACPAARRRARRRSPELGKPITEADLALWDISIGPDGAGLPPGSGTPAQGAVSTRRNASCATARTARAAAMPLVGRRPAHGHRTARPSPTTCRYATTIFDFIRRAMPWQQPKSLTNDEVYAVTAYILALNKIIGENDVMNAETLPKVRMPNRDGFVIRFPDKM